MKIAVIGAGFTGLSSALYLVKNSHQVTVFEKEKSLGGLVQGYKEKNWQWTIEKHYHHWFTNDDYALKLIKDLGLQKDLLLPSPLTSIFYNNVISPFNSPIDVITFPHLNLLDRLRCGVVLLFLKILPPQIAIRLEKYKASDWLKKYFGAKTYQILWQPLLEGKFGKLINQVNMAWFWARIKKRTLKLVYLKGGYHRLLETLAKEIKKSGGQIILGSSFEKNMLRTFDRVIFTAPSSVFVRILPDLPSSFSKRLKSIPHLHALNLLLITKDKILEKEYWLNINDRSFPFLGVVAHTNFVDKKYYGGKHLTWIANYLPSEHPYLKMTKEKLFSIYKPYLQKINPHFNYRLTTNDYQLFFGPFAQPVVGVNYSKIKPDFKTPLTNVILANMDMVYPWDRGTNYAIELGINAAKYLEKTIEN